MPLGMLSDVLIARPETLTSSTKTACPAWGGRETMKMSFLIILFLMVLMFLFEGAMLLFTLFTPDELLLVLLSKRTHL